MPVVSRRERGEGGRPFFRRIDRKWRRKPLKTLDSRPEMVSVPNAWTRKIWARGGVAMLPTKSFSGAGHARRTDAFLVKPAQAGPEMAPQAVEMVRLALGNGVAYDAHVIGKA